MTVTAVGPLLGLVPPTTVLGATEPAPGSDPVPGLILLTLLLGGTLLWVRRRRVRARRIAAGLPPGGDGPKGWRRLKRPAVVLAVLAPFCLEGYAGAMPPQVFFNPVVTIYLIAFYGSAAILIREVTLAWRKGWPSVLAMGTAYAICEEGLATKVFFDPGRTEMGPQLDYGTWAGVHVPYTFHLLVVHAVFSIAVPIFLTTLLFPEQASTPWVRRRTLPVLGAVFVAVIVVANLLIYRYHPTPVHYVVAIAVVVALVGVARVLPTSITLRPPLVTTPRRLGVLGFAIMFVFFVVSYLFAAWGVPPALTLVLEIVIVAGWAWTAARISGSVYHHYAFVAGMLGFFVFTSFILLAAGSFLQPIVSLAGGCGLVWLGRRLRARGADERDAPSDGARVGDGFGEVGSTGG